MCDLSFNKVQVLMPAMTTSQVSGVIRIVGHHVQCQVMSWPGVCSCWLLGLMATEFTG